MLGNLLTKNCHSESPSSRGQAYFRIFYILSFDLYYLHYTFVCSVNTIIFAIIIYLLYFQLIQELCDL